MLKKDFFGGNLRNLGFFDSLNFTLHRIAARLRFGVSLKGLSWGGKR
jgi:hypothetical protein